MSRNQKDEVPQRHGEPDRPLTKANESVERDPMKEPVQPTNAEPTPAERPAFDWAEHED
jgi:hypothetical protein